MSCELNRMVKTTMTLGLIAFVTLAIDACRSDLLHPKEGTNSEYPCGIRGVVCPNDKCCPENHVCGDTAYGYFNRCTPGFCCYEGDDWPGAGPDAGKRPASIVKQVSR